MIATHSNAHAEREIRGLDVTTDDAGAVIEHNLIAARDDRSLRWSSLRARVASGRAS
jgi:hypothetical protein